VFAYGDDWWHNACLNYASDSMHLYASGYQEAAKRLFKHVSDTHINQDVLLYPIVYLWRHYVELTLKGLIQSAKRLRKEEVTFPHTHHLLQLWQVLMPLLRSIEPARTADFEPVPEIIRQLDGLDPDSMVFRYPKDRNNQGTLPEDLLHINLRNLDEVMGRLASFLDACDTMLDYYENLIGGLDNA
jgi:HEPN domain-containing protein